MMNQNAPMLFENEEFGRLDTFIIDNTPWFIGRQVATMLGYTNPQKAVRDHVGDADKRTERIVHPLGKGGEQATILINEYGVSDLFLLSKLPEAKKFRHWFTHEVLPSIRKTGSYSLPNLPAPVEPKRISSVIDELGLTANKLVEVFGVAKGIALSKATVLVEENYSVNLNAVKGLLPPAENNVGLLNPTQIAELLSPKGIIKLSARLVNQMLLELGLQEKAGDEYQLTEAGKEYGEMMPYTRNGHSGYRPLWKKDVIEYLKHCKPEMCC